MTTKKEKFPYNPIHLLCMQIDKLCMRSIVSEDNSNPLRYWIYTLIIITYCMNKRGFHFALSFCRLSSSPTSILLSFSPSYFPGSLRIIFPFFLFPLQVSNSLPLAYQLLFYTTTLRGSVENYPSKNHLSFTWLVNIPKNLHYNLLIHLFKAFSRCTKTCIGFFSQLGPLWVSFLLRWVHLKTDPNSSIGSRYRLR